MAKYDVHFSCGHTETKELYGKVSIRMERIAYWERWGVCSACYREQKEMEAAANCDEVEMYYGDYKKNYPNCRTKTGSYDGDKKTVIVYVPKDAGAGRSAS